MKFLIPLLAAVSSSYAHYIFKTLIVNGQESTAAVRQPADNSPVLGINDPGMTCNSKAQASETLSIAAGSSITFKVDPSMYHKGSGALYLGKAPSTAAAWDGSGKNWFKIADFGATFNPFKFVLDGATEMTTTIPADIPAGEYLIRAEHTALHSTKPEWYISCGQIKVTGGGNASPAMVSIPGHLDPNSPGLNTDIYYPTPTSWTMPGPAAYVAGNGNGNTPAPPTTPEQPSTPSTPTPSQPGAYPSDYPAYPPANPPASVPAAPQPSTTAPPSCKAKFKRTTAYGTRLPRAAMAMHKRHH